MQKPLRITIIAFIAFTTMIGIGVGVGSVEYLQSIDDYYADTLLVERVYYSGSPSTQIAHLGGVRLSDSSSGYLLLQDVYQQAKVKNYSNFQRNYRQKLPHPEAVWRGEEEKCILRTSSSFEPAKLKRNRLLIIAACFLPLLVVILWQILRRKASVTATVLLFLTVTGFSQEPAEDIPLYFLEEQLDPSASYTMYSDSSFLSKTSNKLEYFELNTPENTIQCMLSARSEAWSEYYFHPDFIDQKKAKPDSYYRKLAQQPNEDLKYSLEYKLQLSTAGYEVCIVRFRVYAKGLAQHPIGLYSFVLEGNKWKYAPGLFDGDATIALCIIDRLALAGIISKDHENNGIYAGLAQLFYEDEFFNINNFARIVNSWFVEGALAEPEKRNYIIDPEW
ncbi:MAG: hypothetical protein AAFO03_14435 [Bacteroidota bacterium]